MPWNTLKKVILGNDDMEMPAAEMLADDQGLEAAIHEYIISDNQMRPWLYAETRPPVIWMGKTCCRRVEIWEDGWLTGKKFMSKKRSSKTIDIVSYAQK